MSSTSYDGESSSNAVVRTQVNNLDDTAVLTDNLTLVDVLQILKDQVRGMATKVSQLDQYLNLINNQTDPFTHQEVLKAKQNIINNITILLKETKPLDYPSFQSLCSVKLLKTYEKISAECKILLNNIIDGNESMNTRINGFEKLTTFITDFQREVDNIVAQDLLNQKVEHLIDQDFRDCRNDLYDLLKTVDPSSGLKEILSLLVENDNEDDEDSWVDIEDIPHLAVHCQKLKQIGFILQNEQNRNLYKLNTK